MSEKIGNFADSNIVILKNKQRLTFLFMTKQYSTLMNKTPEDFAGNKHFYCLILAGGKGRRLWPISRAERPKQFLDFFGTGKSLLQQTYERFLQFLPKENIFVSTYAEYKDIVNEQLPDLDDSRLLCEPIRRNTAPIVAWATHRIENIDPAAALIVSPSDQIITNEPAFQYDVLDCMMHVSLDGCFLTMGIRPGRPEPGYGYIQLGENSAIDQSSAESQGFYKVQSFIEKPEREFAEMFMNSGEFLWNTGLYISTVKTIHNRLMVLLPGVMRALDAAGNGTEWESEVRWVEEHYATYPNMSLESGILERCEDVCVKECGFGWADIGSWHGIYEAMSTSPDDNVVLDTDSMLSETTGCLISLPKGRKAIITGLHNFIVTEHDDVLLISPRSDSSSQVVKQENKFYNK